jgi:hypothetical protein
VGTAAAPQQDSIQPPKPVMLGTIRGIDRSAPMSVTKQAQHAETIRIQGESRLFNVIYANLRDYKNSILLANCSDQINQSPQRGSQKFNVENARKCILNSPQKPVLKFLTFGPRKSKRKSFSRFPNLRVVNIIEI